jgi:TolB-like protein/cytochrome c-type biogenesis protein CcmH/NrfG
MRQYQKCCQTLEQYQLGQPQEATVLLFQSLYYDTVVQPVFETETRKPDESQTNLSAYDAVPAIAVLPFNDLMKKPDAYSLSTALTEDMVNELRRFHGFRVISALSSLSLKGQNCDLKTAATMLGARYLVCGSIRQSQQKIQIAVELVDAENGELIWAERYTRKIEDLFVLQAELARDIAGNIEPEAVGHAYLLSNRKIPTSLTAWDLVLRGDHQLYQQLGTRWNSDEAQSLYRMAIEQDPDYAPSYAGLAYSLCLELKEGIAEEQQYVEKLMLENAEHAVRLDESNPWCQVILGRVQQQLKEYDAAVMTYRKAVELCPSSSKAHFGLSFGLSVTGQYDEAIESIDRAIELSPRDPMSWSYHTVKALTYIYSEKFDLAASSSEVSSSYTTANHWAPVLLAPSLIHLGHYDEALKVLEKAKRMKPDLSVHAVTEAFATRNEADTLAIQEGLMDAGLKK